VQAVVRRAATADLSAWTTVHRGAIGDARASAVPSFGGTRQESLGIFLSIAASRQAAVALWTDIRNAERCPAVEAFRQSLVDRDRLPIPVLGTDCPPTFGNSDIYAIAISSS
jgi:hypothetical protein